MKERGETMNELEKYLESVVSLCHYPITISADNHVIVRGLLVKKTVASQEQLSVEPILDREMQICQEFEEADEAKWRYVTKQTEEFVLEDYFETTKEHEVLSALYGMYSSKDQLIYFNVRQALPASIWINGKLMIKSTDSYHIKPACFLVNMKRGINTILIQRQVTECHLNLDDSEKKCLLIYAPLTMLRNMKAEPVFNFDYKVRELEKKCFMVLGNIFGNDKSLDMIVLPQYPVKIHNDVLQIIDLNGIVVAESEVKLYEVNHIELPDCKTIVKLKFQYFSESEYYIPIANVDTLFDMMREYGESEAFLEFAQKVLGKNVLTNWGKAELIYQRIYQFVLRHIYRKLSTCHFVEDSVMVKKFSEIDQGARYYTLFFPEDYTEQKTDSLVVLLSFGTVGEILPEALDYELQGKFKDCIIMGLYKKGSNNKDFIDEMAFLNDLQDVVNKYQIKRNKIYIVGVCAGALVALGLAIRFPDLFAGVGIVNGTVRLDLQNPDYKYINNVNHLNVIHLNSVNDNFFNTARVYQTGKYFGKMNMYLFDLFDHKAGIEELDTKLLLEEVIKSDYVKYPKTVSLYFSEERYNKSFWMYAGKKKMKEMTASIICKMDSGTIQVDYDNLQSVKLYLAREEMNLGREIKVLWDSQELQVTLSSYDVIDVDFDEARIRCQSISKEKFFAFYERIGMSEERLGMKEIYTKRCGIVFAGAGANKLSREQRKLARKLQHPLKERSRTYHYSIVGEEALEEAFNIIYVDDAEIETPYGNLIRKELQVKVSTDCIWVRNVKYEAPYYAFLMSKNYSSSGKSILYIIESNARDEMLTTFKEIEDSPFFNGEALIFSKGQLTCL